MAGEWCRYNVSELIEKEALAIGDGYRAKNAELSRTGLPFARASNIGNGFHFSDADCFPEDHTYKLGEKISRPGDVVFTSKGTVGRFAFVREETPRFVYSPQLCYWRPLDKEILDARFLYYWMASREFLLQVKSVASQTDMAEYVSLRDQRQMHITAPPPPEQRAISHILGTLDDKIELNRRMNETLEAMSRALFKSWFVDFDPVRAKMEGHDPGLPQHIADLFPDRLVESELGQIPEGWEVKTLGSVADNPRRGVRAQEIDPGTPYIALEHMPKQCIALSEWGTADDVSSGKFEFTRGDILFGKLRPYFHKVGIAPLQGVCSTDIVVISPVSHDWFGFILGHVSSSEFVDYTSAGSTGTKMPRTKWSDMAGGLNPSTQHFALKGGGGVYADEAKSSSRLHAGGTGGGVGSVETRGVAQVDWTSVL